jgi:hypothetical protein
MKKQEIDKLALSTPFWVEGLSNKSKQLAVPAYQALIIAYCFMWKFPGGCNKYSSTDRRPCTAKCQVFASCSALHSSMT